MVQLPAAAPESAREAISTYFDDVPVYGYNRVNRQGERDQWMVVYPRSYTYEMLSAVCQRLPPPAACDYVGSPLLGGLPIVIATAYENELRSSNMANSYTPGAMYIEVDGKTKMLGSHASAAVPGSWGLDRIDSSKLDGMYNVKGGGQGINVYHMDTGVLPTLNEFDGRVTMEFDATRPKMSDWCPMPAPRLCSRRQGRCKESCAVDRSGHGTHTAGTLGSKTYGVASGVLIHSMKVLGDDGTGSWSSFVEGLDYVTTNGKKPAIVTASLGGPGHIQSVKDVIEAATKAQVVVVVAAGNENQNACEFSPAFVPQAITVGSTDKQDKRSPFSNYGNCVDIFAPGSSITSLDLQEGKTATGSGTSMSAPHVAGAAAILMVDNPSMLSGISNHLQTNALTGVITDSLSNHNKLLHIGRAPLGDYVRSMASAIRSANVFNHFKKRVAQSMSYEPVPVKAAPPAVPVPLYSFIP